MSLIKCKVCGNHISSKLKNCPYCDYPVQNKSSKLPIGYLIIILFIIFAIVININNTSKTEAVSKVNNTNKLAYELATINKGGYVSETDITITRFDYLLRSLENKTFESKSEIADMTVKCQKILREKYGIEMKLLSIMEDLNDSIPSGSKVKYAEIAGVYIQQIK